MSRWPMVTLGNLVSVQGGGTPSRSDKANWNGEIPWVSPKDMKRQRLADAQEHVSASVVQGGRLSLLPAGSLLVVVRGMILVRAVPVALADVPLTINQDMKALACNGETEPEYLLSVLLSREQTLLGKVSTAAHGTRKLDTKELLGLPIPLPPLDEQRRIVDLLNRAAGIRRLREQALATARNTIPALFLQTFGDPATNPKGWPVVRLGDAAGVQGGLQVSGKRAGLPEERPYLRVANVHRDRLELSEIKTIRLTTGEAERTKLEAGDILIVEGHGNPAEIGRAAIWDGSIVDCVHQNHLIRVRTDPALLSPEVAYLVVNSVSGRQALLRSGKTTSGLNTISTANVKAVPIPLPPLDLQRRFADRLADLRGIVTQQERALATARTLERALLARLLE